MNETTEVQPQQASTESLSMRCTGADRERFEKLKAERGLKPGQLLGQLLDLAYSSSFADEHPGKRDSINALHGHLAGIESLMQALVSMGDADRAAADEASAQLSDALRRAEGAEADAQGKRDAVERAEAAERESAEAARRAEAAELAQSKAEAELAHAEAAKAKAEAELAIANARLADLRAQVEALTGRADKAERAAAQLQSEIMGFLRSRGKD